MPSGFFSASNVCVGAYLHGWFCFSRDAADRFERYVDIFDLEFETVNQLVTLGMTIRGGTHS